MEDAEGRLLTVPNGISFVRLLCIPVFVYLVFGAEREALAAVVLAILGATDWVDGYIARRFNQVSAVGKFFDPATDRLLLLVAAITIIVVGAMPLWFGVLALAREAFIIVGGIVLATRGVRGLDVEYIGKAGAFGLMISLPFFLVADSGVSWHLAATVMAWICGVPGLVLSYVSAWHYFRQGRAVLKQAKHAHATPVPHETHS